jgi:hypothetical protein
MIRARTLVASLASIAVTTATLLVLTEAPAQQPKATAPKGVVHPPRRRPPAHTPAADGGASAAPTDTSAGAAPLAPGSKDTSDAGAVVVQKSGDGGAQTIRFGSLEIEGQLKSPQLVYFLRRVRAEFAAGDLGHRSFLRELSESRKDPSF